MSRRCLLIASLLLGLTARASPADEPKVDEPNRFGPAGIAILDVGRVFKEHRPFLDDLDSIKTAIKEFDEQVQKQRNEIAAQTEQLKSLPEGSKEHREAQTKIALETTQLQVDIAAKRNEFLRAEAVAYATTYQQLQEAVKNYSRKHGIRLVLRSANNPLNPDNRDSVLKGVNRDILFEDNLEITDDILAMLSVQAVVNSPPKGT